MELENQIRKYLAEKVLYVDGEFDYDDECSFIGEGLIDSMGVMELVAYAQSAFGITIEQRDITPDNFDSVKKLASFIRRKRQGSAENSSQTEEYVGSERVRE